MITGQANACINSMGGDSCGNKTGEAEETSVSERLEGTLIFGLSTLETVNIGDELLFLLTM